MYYVYLIIITSVFLLAGVISLIFSLEFFTVSLLIGCIILLLGVISSTENHLKSMKQGLYSYELQQEIRREKEKMGDYDYSNRYSTFGIGFMLRICGLVIIILSFVFSLF